MAAPTLSQLDSKFIWHPFTQMQTARDPIVIAKAKGVYLYDENGNGYIDGISSWWVNLHGHAHPYIVEKISTQAQRLEHVLFADFTHPPAIELASRLIPLLPGDMSKIFYSDNGSTSVEVAIKIALQYWYNKKIPKTKIICFKNSYHGDTFGCMSAAGKNHFNRPFWGHLFDVETVNPPCSESGEASLHHLVEIIEKGNIACLIYEPLIMGSGGMIIHSPFYLNKMLQLCRQHDVLLIADEVMTGFGRTGTLFAGDQLDEKPDLICLSKGLTGGFLPLGATACTDTIYQAFLGDSLSQAFLHGHSYTANPLSCTSAIASLDLLLTDSCFLRRKAIADSHQQFCQKYQGHPKLKRCDFLGTILILEYHSTTPSYFDSLRDKLYRFFLDRGILLRPLGNVLYVLPPYVIQNDELEKIYTQIIKTLEGSL